MKKIKLASKRERWGLTANGWLLLLLVLALMFFIFVKKIVPFLSEEETVDARVMVVEGYVPDYAFQEIINVFNRDNYDLLIASGTYYDQGFFITGIETSAQLIANSLLFLGFDSTKLAVVPVPIGTHINRTYHSALITRAYLRQNYPTIDKINIFSLGPHARRSKCLFEMVYEPDIKVGNIVIPHVGINAKNWYKSSRGFRTVTNEVIAYIYVKLFFWPDDSEKVNTTKS